MGNGVRVGAWGGTVPNSEGFGVAVGVPTSVAHNTGVGIHCVGEAANELGVPPPLAARNAKTAPSANTPIMTRPTTISKKRCALFISTSGSETFSPQFVRDSRD